MVDKVKLTKDQAAALVGKRVTLQVSDRTVRESTEWGGKNFADFLKTNPTLTVARHDEWDNTFKFEFVNSYGNQDIWWAPVSWFKPADTDVSTLDATDPRLVKLGQAVLARLTNMHADRDAYGSDYEILEELVQAAGFTVKTGLTIT